MPRARIACRTDGNQKGIVAALRKIPGVSVAVTSGCGDGFPDLVVGYALQNYLIELKDPAKAPSARKLTPEQLKFHQFWTGQVAVCETVGEIFVLIGAPNAARATPPHAPD